MWCLRPAFKTYGSNFIFDSHSVFTYKNIQVGDDVFIGEGAHFSATNSQIEIGDKVMFGPGVTMMTGDHNTSVIGKYMKDVKTKKDTDDQAIIIQKDVWIGANVTILKGVTIGEGSIIAAGALVITNVEPYSIYGGVPAKIIKKRFSPEEIIKHKKMINKV